MLKVLEDYIDSEELKNKEEEVKVDEYENVKIDQIYKGKTKAMKIKLNSVIKDSKRR